MCEHHHRNCSTHFKTVQKGDVLTRLNCVYICSRMRETHIQEKVHKKFGPDLSGSSP